MGKGGQRRKNRTSHTLPVCPVISAVMLSNEISHSTRKLQFTELTTQKFVTLQDKKRLSLTRAIILDLRYVQ